MLRPHGDRGSVTGQLQHGESGVQPDNSDVMPETVPYNNTSSGTRRLWMGITVPASPGAGGGAGRGVHSLILCHFTRPLTFTGWIQEIDASSGVYNRRRSKDIIEFYLQDMGLPAIKICVVSLLHNEILVNKEYHMVRLSSKKQGKQSS